MEQQDDGQRPAASSASAELRDYAAHMVVQRLRKMLSYAGDVRDNEDAEAVHKMRVASRRARAALEAFDGCFHASAYIRIEREVKQVTDALSAVRDLDVMSDRLLKELADLPVEQRSGVEGLVEKLHKRRKASQRRVVRILKRLEQDDLNTSFKSVAAARGVRKRSLRHSDRQEKAHG